MKGKITSILMVIALLVIVSLYGLTFEDTGRPSFESKNEIHLLVQHYRNGVLISQTYHTMTITNFGKNQTRDLLGGVNTNAMLYLGCSNSTDVFDATWTALPSEIVGNGLDRALGTYALDLTGNGKWNVTHTWMPNATQTTELYGIYSTAYNGATLCYAEQQGAGAAKNLASGDTLALTAQGTAS